MSRIFMSFLGTSSYAQTNYRLDGGTCLTCFVQVALLEFLGSFDRCYIFVTSDARSKNWNALCAEMRQKGKDPALLTPVDIPAGKNPEEIWEIFSAIQAQLPSESSVVFDTTHSFRSIPILALACIQYAGVRADVRLERILYGAWEASEFSGEPNAAPVTPIFDLTAFVELMNWSHAILEFSRYGTIGAMKGLIRQPQGASYLDNDRTKQGKSREVSGRLKQNLHAFIENFDKLQRAIWTCRGKMILEGAEFERSAGNLRKLKNKPKDLPPAFGPLLDVLDKKISVLKGPENLSVSESIRRGLGAVRWCLDHGLIQQAYTILQETLISHFCEQIGIDGKKRENRELVSQAAHTLEKPFEEWKTQTEENDATIRRIHQDVHRDLIRNFCTLSAFRNDINHMKVSSTTSPDTLIEQIESAYQKTIRLLGASMDASSVEL